MNDEKKQPNENNGGENTRYIEISTSSNEYTAAGRNIDFLLDNEKTEKSSEEKLEELFKIELQKQFLQGLKGGMFVVSQTVLEKLNDISKPLMDRISDIKRYCKVSISQKKDDKQAE